MATKEEQIGDSLDFLADIFEPLMVICTNEKIKTAYRSNRMKLVKTLVEEAKPEAIEIVKAIDKADGVDYEYNGITFSFRLIEILNKYAKDLQPFFNLLGQKTDDGSSGSATGNIEGEEK